MSFSGMIKMNSQIHALAEKLSCFDHFEIMSVESEEDIETGNAPVAPIVNNFNSASLLTSTRANAVPEPMQTLPRQSGPEIKGNSESTEPNYPVD